MWVFISMDSQQIRFEENVLKLIYRKFQYLIFVKYAVILFLSTSLVVETETKQKKNDFLLVNSNHSSIFAYDSAIIEFSISRSWAFFERIHYTSSLLQLWKWHFSFFNYSYRDIIVFGQRFFFLLPIKRWKTRDFCEIIAWFTYRFGCFLGKIQQF